MYTIFKKDGSIDYQTIFNRLASKIYGCDNFSLDNLNDEEIEIELHILTRLVESGRLSREIAVLNKFRSINENLSLSRTDVK